MNTLTSIKPSLSTPQSSLRHHNFLSIGTRGVGKTVFFVGHYNQSTESHTSENSSLRFECHEAETRETIDKIGDYVAREGAYPPATMKMTNFDFLVQNKEDTSAPLCEVCWWDTPGESCQLYNPAFLTMMLSVDGSCLFLDGQKLVKSAGNAKELKEQLAPIQAFADLLHHNGFNYPIALIVTKCDLLKEEKDWVTLKQILKGLQQHWDNLKVNYRLFYSEIPIVEQENRYTLQAKGQENPLLWLVEAAEASEKSNPPVITTDDTQSEAIADQPQKSKWGIPVFLSKKTKILLSFVAATALLSLGSIFLVEQAVQSEQNNTPAVLPAQYK